MRKEYQIKAAQQIEKLKLKYRRGCLTALLAAFHLMISYQSG